MSTNNRRGNSNFEKINTTTRVAQVYNPTGEDAASLVLKYWNDLIVIEIAPMLPKAKQKDGKMYDYDNAQSITLNIGTSITLDKGIKLLDKKLRGKELSNDDINNYAVKTQQKYVAAVGYGGYDGIDSPYLVLHEVDKSNVSQGSIFFVFDPLEDDNSTLLVNYDESDGSAKTHTVNVGWEIFKRFFELSTNNLINGGVQTVAHSLNVKVRLLENKLEGGASSGGSSSGGGRTFGNTSNRRRTGSTSGGSSSEGTESTGRRQNKTVVDESDDISDIEREMMEEMNLDDE